MSESVQKLTINDVTYVVGGNLRNSTTRITGIEMEAFQNTTKFTIKNDGYKVSERIEIICTNDFVAILIAPVERSEQQKHPSQTV